MNDERLYAKVADELRLHGPNAGLWAKAFADSDGVESKGKALYLRYRVAQLTEAERIADHLEVQAQAKLKREAKVKEAQERYAREQTEAYKPIQKAELMVVGLAVITLLCIVALALAISQ